jgi:putative ABC transport system permease protein
VGGVLGVLLGAGSCWAAALVLRRLVGNWPLHIELWAVAAGIGASVASGVTFGLYPALRAARLQLVEALRRE